MRVDSVATRQFQPKPALTPPSGRRCPLGLATQNLFRTPLDACLTVVSVASIAFFSVVIFEWAVTEAVWEADSRRECLDRSPAGACWAGVRAWWSAFMYGRYTEVERWRVDAGLVLVVIVFTLGGAFGYVTACVSRWLGQALLSSRSDERVQLGSQLSGALRLLYTALTQSWKLVWWSSWWLRRRSGKVQLDVAD